MPTNFPHDDPAGELDALPPALLPLHRRLLDDSAAWQHKLPSAEDLAQFARATPQQAASTVTPPTTLQNNTKGRVFMNDSVPVAQSPKPPLRGFIPAFVAIVVVVLLAAIFIHFHGSTRSVTPGSHAAPTTATACAYHATMPAAVTVGGIAMTGPDDGWAIGASNGSTNANAGVLLHYVHCVWQVVGASYPDISLTSVVMLSAQDGWITGGSDDGSQQLLLHFVAGAWQRVTVPDGLAAGGRLDKMVMVGADEGWLEVVYPKDVHGLTHYSLLHYQQGTWAGVTAPLAYIADISTAAPNEVWIVGSLKFNDGTTILAHYVAGAWHQQSGPTQLEAAQIHMTAPTAGVVVFSLYGANNLDKTVKNVAWSYDGTTWSPLDLGGDRTGQEIILLSSTQGWAFSKTYAPSDIGYETPISGADYAVGGHWQPITWPLANFVSVDGLSRVTDDEYWAIGSKRESGTQRGVFLHYLSGVWSEVDS